MSKQKNAPRCGGCDIDESGRLHDLSCPVARTGMEEAREQTAWWRWMARLRERVWGRVLDLDLDERGRRGYRLKALAENRCIHARFLAGPSDTGTESGGL